MASWIYTTNTVAEAPFAWNPLMERFRMDRGISTIEVSPGVYEEIRFTAYTDESGAVNLPTYELPPQYDRPRAGLHFFRGGYQHTVDDTVKANLIASGVATSSNFTPAP